MVFLFAAALAAVSARAAPAVDATDAQDSQLERGFASPPASARPWVYWFWLDGNVTREGITADLEAMQRVGIGGVLLFDISQDVPPGPVRFGTPEWRDLFKHAVSEAARLGLQIDINNSSGWTGSGGPWITPDLGMQRVCYARTNLIGPTHFSGLLPQPIGYDKFCHDIAVLAFPAIAGEGGPLPGWPPKVTSSAPEGFDGAKLVDGTSVTFVTLPAPTPGKPQFLDLSFAEPFTAFRLNLRGVSASQMFTGRLQVSDDGSQYRDIREFASVGGGLAFPFEQISARHFRLLFTGTSAGYAHLAFSDLELEPNYHIDSFLGKSGMGPLPPAATDQMQLAMIPPEGIIAPQTVVDLTRQCDQDGRLKWNAPTGHWTVLRLACQPTGMQNHPATPGGAGLECDKLSQKAVEAQFAGFLGKIINENSSAAGHTFSTAHIDSWEVGYQDWTPAFCEEFKRRRGYDPLLYLPTLTGRYVGSPEQTERFLWDVRRTIADLVADNYAGHMAALLHQHGMVLSIEPYGSEGSGPFDDLQYGGRADIPMLEFWAGPPDYSDFQLYPFASVAHSGGKPVLAAEAFSSYPQYAKWQQHPFIMKPRADAAFCEGVNRLVFHRFIHQPWLNLRPGITMGMWGSHYERTQTWWEKSLPWHQYVARCQFLLQKGLFVADACYLTSEGAFTKAPLRSQLTPPLPDGHRYDVLTPESVLDRMSVTNGCLMLPDGMSYRAMVLPQGEFMTPKLLHKIKNLVESGATIIGPRPVRSPSLKDYPHCDAEVKQLAADLWGSCDGKVKMDNRFGKGTIIWGKPLGQVMTELAVAPDFEVLGTEPRPRVRFIHRQFQGTDVYFLAQASLQSIHADCAFRVTGKEPEFWHPDTGRTERVPVWQPLEHDRILLPITLGPADSLFVIFRRSSQGADPITSIRRDGVVDPSTPVRYDEKGKLCLTTTKAGVYEIRTNKGRKLGARIDGLPPPIVLSTQWEVRFPAGWGAPASIMLPHLISWTEHPDSGVRYFSGTATYTSKIQLSPDLLAASRRLYLDLGKVQVIAQLSVNGHDFGVLWKPPFETDVTTAAKAGDNIIEVKVTNLWPNRLIGDEYLPEDCAWQLEPDGTGPLAEWPRWLIEGRPRPSGRLTFTTWKHWTKGSPLLVSGLLGPVTLQPAAETELE